MRPSCPTSSGLIRASSAGRRESRRGMALVITLIMLSVVTLMAVTFLALSRRERSLITATADLTAAKLAADAGSARAQAELVARVAAHTNRFAYDLTVSTNLYSRAGFVPNLSSYTNVSYTYANGARLDRDDLLRNLTNLWYDSRPPVFVVTNSSLPLDNPARAEFRYYLDLNRNGMFDTNGLQPIVTAGLWSPTNLGHFIGDPEWVGILEHPDQPHSPSNLFVGRYAYLMLPAGKSLDLNYVHNSAKNPYLNRAQLRPIPEGYMRNQGVGSWELNLAAFLQTLLPASYDPYYFVTNLGASSTSLAFQDALEILRHRYDDDLFTLRTVEEQFGVRGSVAFRNDQIDGYGDGALVLDNRLLENGVGSDVPDDPTRRWSGSDSAQGFYNLHEFFDPAKTAPSGSLQTNLTRRLLSAGTNGFYSSNRFAFTRLLAQMGTDSLPTAPDRLNLNYDNVFRAATNFVPWTNGLSFFTNAADRLLLQHPSLQRRLADGIPIYPLSAYTPDVHRLLQLAANLGDALTNRVMLTNNLFAPSVFRPIFTNSVQGSTNFVSIIGYEEIFSTNALNQTWLEVTNMPTGRVVSGVNVYGVPWVVGVKKGLPNFNEFQLQSAAQVSRRVEARKGAGNVITYHQSWALTVTNSLGAEVWNSYTQAFPPPLTLWVRDQYSARLRDAATNPPPPVQPILRATNLFFSSSFETNLVGNGFLLPLDQALRFLPESAYLPRENPPLRPVTNYGAIQFSRIPDFSVPDWKLEITNRFQLALIARGRVIDFVNFDNMRASLDISGKLAETNQSGGQLPPPGAPGRPGSVGPTAFWATNVVSPNGMTLGIATQIRVSTNDLLSDTDWHDFSPNPVSGQQKRDAIDGFRVFLGMEPLFDPAYRAKHPELASARTRLVPYTPSVKMDQTLKWQANDPLVHYHLEDLYHLRYTSTNNSDVSVLAVQSIQPVQTNLRLPNDRFDPWGGPPGKTGGSPATDYNLTIKDPLVSRSDDWEFPTNLFPTLGSLGRVHRGTPWQTIYLKSPMATPREWVLQGGGRDPLLSLLRHPTNDWRLLELFTVAPNDNASRGLLSVNQTNEAAWAAVLCGVTVLTNNADSGTAPRYGALFIEPNTWQFTNLVYSINSNRVARGGTFQHMGDVLSSPALTVTSPYLNPNGSGISDAAYERIPQQILSLLKEDEPYVVIYSYGQSLKPAERSRITAPGTYFNLCTNYQITGEVLTKTGVRLEEFRGAGSDTNTYYQGIVESYHLLPTD